MLSVFCPAPFAAVFSRLEIRTLNYWTLFSSLRSGASFLTAGLVEYKIYHRLSVALLWTLYKIRCNPMPPLYDALHMPCVPVRVTPWLHTVLWSLNGIRIRLFTAEPRIAAWLLFSSVPLWNDLGDRVLIIWCETGGY